MAQPRFTFQYNRIGGGILDVSYPVDSSIVLPTLTAQGFNPGISAQVGLAVVLTNEDTAPPMVGLGAAGNRLLGKLMGVDPNGAAMVQDFGFMYLPMVTGANQPFVGGSVVTDGTGKVQRAATVAAVNQVNTLTMTGTATAGTFTLTFDGQTTAPIAYNATGAQTATALNLLPNVGAGGFTGSGSALGPLVLTAAAQLTGQPLPNFVVDNTAMTGGTYASAITTAGVAASSIYNGTIVHQVGITDPFPPSGTTAAASGSCLVLLR